jgi:hypothetical protein
VVVSCESLTVRVSDAESVLDLSWVFESHCLAMIMFVVFAVPASQRPGVLLHLVSRSVRTFSCWVEFHVSVDGRVFARWSIKVDQPGRSRTSRHAH